MVLQPSFTQARWLSCKALIDDFPPEAIAEAEKVRSINLKAHAGIPIHVDGRLIGLITFGAFL